jgi:uncharacterized protein YndB with AHSA1/START domain
MEEYSGAHGRTNYKIKMTDFSLIPEINLNREIITTRDVDFPVDTVFESFVNPDHLKNWWGPAGFTNTFHEFNPVPYGSWKFTMHGPDGKNYGNESMFIVVQKPDCIIIDHINAPEFRAVFQFESLTQNTTSIHWRMIFKTEQLFNALGDFVKGKNVENMDRLERELSKVSS